MPGKCRLPERHESEGLEAQPTVRLSGHNLGQWEFTAVACEGRSLGSCKKASARLCLVPSGEVKDCRNAAQPCLS